MKTEIIDNRPKSNYTDDFILSLGQTDRVFAPLYSGNFIKPIWNGQSYEESATAEEIQSIDRQRQIKEIKAKYEFHRDNGWNAYQEFRAIIVSDIYAGKITELQAFSIEQFLKVAYDRISQNGDWKTARHELSQVTGYPEFVAEYYDLAMNYIDDYILNNYDS